MFSHNFKFAVRTLLGNKVYTLINILGLSFGISAFILLFLYSRNELTYDSFHKNIASIYHIAEKHDRTNVKTELWRQTRAPVLPKILADYPEIKNGSRVQERWFKIQNGENSNWEQFAMVDSGFFSIFTFKPIAGNLQNSFKEPNSVVITEKIAHKYFGDDNPIGKSFTFDNKKSSFVVSAVIEDVPNNSSIKFDLVAYYPFLEKLYNENNNPDAWYNVNHSAFVILKDGVSPQIMEAKFQPMVNKYFLTGDEAKPKLLLMPFSTEHSELSGNKSFIFILICIAIGILFIATINFVNLSNVRSLTRSKEIGVRKVLGADKRMLIIQFLCESLIISIIALSIGVAFAELLLPSFNNMFETRLSLDFISNLSTLFVLITIGLLTGLAAGVLPALYLSAFKPVDTLKGLKKSNKKSINVRNGMVILQFTMAVMLISGTIIIWKQISFMRNQDLHFDKENVVSVKTNMWDFENPTLVKRKIRIIMDELSQDTRVISCAISSELPGKYNYNYNTFYPENLIGKEGLHLRQAYVGADYFKTFGIETADGRDFTEASGKDSTSVIINQSTARQIGEKNITDLLIHQSSSNGNAYKVVGVVKDFNYQGLQSNIEPMIHFYLDTSWNFRYLSVRSKPGKILEVLDLVKEKWQKIDPVGEADFFFPNDEINKQYAMYEHIRTVVGYFSLVAIAISCLGLFALSVFMTDRRTKEIGVRKVLGSSVFQILGLLTHQIFMLVIVSGILGSAIAYFGMKYWQQDFAYKSPLAWWIFVISGIISLAIALVTVIWQAYKAANQNPVKALRYE